MKYIYVYAYRRAHDDWPHPTTEYSVNFDINYLSARVAMVQRPGSLGERLIEGKFMCTEQLTKGGEVEPPSGYATGQ